MESSVHLLLLVRSVIPIPDRGVAKIAASVPVLLLFSPLRSGPTWRRLRAIA